MRSSSKKVLPGIQLSTYTYKLGIPGGGIPEDEADPAVRLRRLEEDYQARIAVLEERLTVEKKEVFAAGLQEGQKQAEEKLQERFAAECRRWAGLLQQAAGARREAFRISETQLVELVIAAVEKIIAVRPPNPERIAQTLRDAFDLLVTKDRLSVVCSPEDAGFIKDLLTEHREEFEEIAKFLIREDPAISPGGCLVETEWGTIDARVEKRLAVIKHIWREAAKEPPPAEAGDES